MRRDCASLSLVVVVVVVGVVVAGSGGGGDGGGGVVVPVILSNPLQRESNKVFLGGGWVLILWI